MVNRPASSARPRKASSSSCECCGKAHCGLGSAQPLSASARLTVVAKSSMPIMVPRGQPPAFGFWAYVPCGCLCVWALEASGGRL